MEENIVTIKDEKYPKLLREIGRDAPKKLYYKGNWPPNKIQCKDNIFDECLAVVGSRRMTSYGRQITQKLVSQIAGAGLTIVSGFMYGIDATAHQAAVDAGGRTIAVMPCGIDLIHPEYQGKLYAGILNSNGLIVSEYEGKFLPTLWSYPRRNRIVAGFSKAVLVVEAGEKSGSLITANFARKFKRKIFVVPCPLTSSVSVGISQLIKNGAEVVAGAEDILKYFNIDGEFDRDSVSIKTSVLPKQRKTQSGRVGLLEGLIVNILQAEPMETDILARNLKTGSAELGTVLSMMEIKGKIRRENGKYYIK